MSSARTTCAHFDVLTEMRAMQAAFSALRSRRVASGRRGGHADFCCASVKQVSVFVKSSTTRYPLAQGFD